jgi:hypothetical protein
VSEPGLVVDKPLKLIGDESNPANVVLEMSGSVLWTAKGGWIEGITFRRPKITSGLSPSSPMLELKHDGKIDMIESIFDNECSSGSVVVLSGSGHKGIWNGLTIRNGGSSGIEMQGDIYLEISNSCIKGNQKDGLDLLMRSSVKMSSCTVEKNHGYGARLSTGCKAMFFKSHFVGNKKGVIYKDTGCNVTSSSNTAIVTVMPEKQIPGFRLTLPCWSSIDTKLHESETPIAMANNPGPY